ncbi:Ig-like domain-containing protein [Micropruina sp.]|uniref:Ig-like domain-containing protein n=1 Tax=Micropruina sp. TaxID=2737536 RepID=UPI0039E5C0A3
MRGRSIVRLLPGLVATLVLGVIATLAISSVGYPVNKLDLHDSGIWVTNDAEQSYGRINKSAVGLDAFLDLPGAAGPQELDVLQDGGAVVEHDATGGSLVPIDTSAVTNNADQAINLKPGSVVDLRGGTIAAVDPATGKVWAGRYDPEQRTVDIKALDPALPALAEVGPAPAGTSGPTVALAVGADGTVHVVSVSGDTLTIAADGGGFAQPVKGFIGTTIRSVQLAAVGARAVLYDETLGLVILPDGRTKQVTAAVSGRLQLSGPDAPGVLLALPEGLLRIGLDDGISTQVAQGIGSTPAAPVRLAGCDFGAWAGTPTTVVRACGEGAAEPMGVTSRAQPLVRPIFRVNRNSLVLNDAADGRVFDLDQQLRLDNWEKIKPKPNQNPNDPENSDKPALKDAEPHANDDRFGARAGRTQLVHPLDNDTDSISSILMINAVRGVPDGYRVEITPDGQALKVTIPAEARDFAFRYVAGNGYHDDEATVQINIKAPSDNDQPELREGATKPSFSVPSFGTLNVAPLGDWRDPESDPVLLVDATSDGEIVPVTPDGRLEYTAAGYASDTRTKLTYRVTDVPGNEVTGEVTLTVLGEKALTGGRPVANPDTARGEVGKPIVIRPLANDLPGSDPRAADTRLTLGGDITAKANLKVTTDQRSGLVTVIASRPGPYFLDYVAAYGSARVDRSQIRIDVAKDAAGFVPQTMPDQAAIRGNNPVRVDVLANDADPQGGLLTVQSAQTDAAVDVSVIGGRWLMITPRAEQVSPNPFTVHYTVSNGYQSAAGDVTVAQLQAVGADTPLTRKDRAVVRDGDTVLINALSNDTSPAGSRLSLVTNLDPALPVGQLQLYDASSSSIQSLDVGQAWVHNDQIRYVAPSGVADTREVTIEYYAATPTGQRAKGEVSVTIKPQPESDDDNHAPRPGDLEARASAGQRIKISLPSSSQDPDGDSVTVAGIGSPPSLGRVVGSSPTSVTYEAYPAVDNVGTDTFSIMVTDRYGKQAAALVRVAVTPPGAPQPPIAIEDNVTAAPGAMIRVDARANDVIARNDKVAIAPLEPLNDTLPAGVKVTTEGFITAQAPDNGQPLLLQYALQGNGGTGPAAGITITPQAGYENPPVIFDEVAVIDGQVATVDVLKRAWDPDGRDERLTAAVLRPDPAISVNGGLVTVAVTTQPQVIAYQVTDERGAQSAALIFVPPSGAGAPVLRPGGLINLDPDSSVTVALDDYVMSPRGRIVRLTTADTLSASPAEKLSIEARDDTHLRVTGHDGYVGPGAVTVQVMDGESATDEGVLSSFVTIPVQVGPVTPVLRCPTGELNLPAGGATRSLDIATLCNVWTADSADASTFSYTADWATAITGVEVTAGRTVQLSATGAAVPGAAGELRIGVAGTRAEPQTLKVKVTRAPLATMQGRSYADIEQGTPVRVPIGISSPLVDAVPGIVKVTQLSGPSTPYVISGTTITFTPPRDAHGEVVFEVTGTDVADKSREDRQVTARFTLVVYGVPGKPSAPRPGPKVQSKAETLTWAAPSANGSPITGYQVKDNRGQITTCPATSCRITGLTNGQWYTFQVRAVNKAGEGEWSEPSRRIRPDQPPPAPTGLRVSNPQDHQVTLSWNPVKFEGTAVKLFHIVVDGREIAVAGSATSKVITGLDNNTIYTIALAAENELAVGPSARIQGQSAGKPLGLNAPSFTAATATGAATALRVSWNLPDKNGPADLTFSVVRDGSKTICSGTSGTSCTDDKVTYDGSTHSYLVTAKNGAGKTSTARASWQAVGVPERPGAPQVSATGKDRTIRVQGTAPDSRGKQSTLRILANGSAVATMAVSARGQSIDRTVTVPADGVSYPITLQVCNEERCGSASTGASATAFGPVQSFSLSRNSASGTSVSFDVTVNPNGRALQVSVDGSNIATTDDRDGTWSRAVTRDLGGYSRSHTFTVTVSDASRSQTRSITLTSEDPPDPKVTLIWGGYTTSNPAGCNYSNHCRYVGARISGATGTLSCYVHDDAGTNFSTRWNQGNGEQITQAYWGYHSDSEWVAVTCGGITDRWYGDRPD